MKWWLSMPKMLRDFAIYMAISFTVILALSISINVLDLKINFGRLPGLDQDLKVNFWVLWKDIFIMTAMFSISGLIFLLFRYFSSKSKI